MWKDNQNRTPLGGVRVKYTVTGLNQDRLLNTLVKNGIALFDVQKTSKTRMTFSIRAKQDKKFFAILNKICYTTNSKSKKSYANLVFTKAQCGYDIEKTGYSGRAYPLFFLITNIGLVIGAIIFTLCTAYLDGFIKLIEFTGSGSVLEREVTEYLQSKGVCENARFSSVDLKRLGDEILASNGSLTFASCSKRGNKLIVELVLANQPSERLNGNQTSMVSDVDGVVESVKVYRGTALVEKGDTVVEGQLLVDGYSLVNEEKIPTFVLATVCIRREFTYEYTSNFADQDERAVIMAKIAFGDEDDGYAVKKQKIDDTYIYVVSLYYKHVVTTG